MDLGLEGKTALITGSSRGIGRVIAEDFAQEGTNVIICGRNYDKLLALEDKLVGEHNVVVGSYQVDATEPEDIKKMFQGIERDIGSIDILVNNVGNIEVFGKFEDLTEDDWKRSFELTFMSAVRFIKICLPYLKKSNQARIINIASLSAHQPSFIGLNPHYGMAKAGLVNLTKNLASDFARYGILVNAVCPSTLAGGGWERNVHDRAKREGTSVEHAEAVMRHEENRKSPLDKMGELKDVADLVLFLASANAKFLTGHCYNVDGGITRSML